ncbi:YfhO family protein [Myxococcota bacterium]|nr:YfhO family protein [Myxococcota bacterium]
MTDRRPGDLLVDPRRAGWVDAGALLIVLLLALPGVVTGTQSFFEFDLYFHHHPFWSLVEQSLAQGELPFWAPGVRAGYPLHANGEAGLLYLPALVANAWLPAHRAIDLFVLFHLWLMGMFSALLLRELGVRPLLALLGAVSLILSARVLGTAFWPNAVAVSAWLPLALYAITRTRRDALVGALLLAAALGLSLLAGRPQRELVCLLLILPYGLFILIGSPATETSVRTSRGSRALALGGGLVWGLLLGAPQILPTLFLLQDSVRAAGVTYANWLPAVLVDQGYADLFQVFMPAVRGDWPEISGYAGLVIYAGFACALGFGWRDLRKGRPLGALGFFLVASGVLFVLAGGGAWSYSLFQSIPGLRSVRLPMRLLFPAVVAAVLAASLGFERLMQHRTSSSWRGVLPLVLLGVAVCDLVWVAWRTVPVAESSVYAIAPGLVAEGESSRYDATGSPHRFYADHMPVEVMGYSDSELRMRLSHLPPLMNLALTSGQRAASGYGEPELAWVAAATRAPRPEILRMLGVDRFFSSRDLSRAGREWREFEPLGRHGPAWLYRFEPLPRALWVPEVVAVGSFEAALATLRDAEFDPTRRALVEVERGLSGGSVNRASGSVVLEVDTPNQVAMKVDAPGPGYLLLFDTWAPGWTAEVDGQVTPVLRANGMFRLVEVPSGASRVEFRYRPPGLVPGLVLAIPALVSWWIACPFAFFRRR